jgi:multidrug resistance protein MdtO
MIFLIPDLTSITALMVVVFAGALAAGYVSAGSERISYAGFQMAFAFFLCVIQGPSPAFDLSTARDRVIGILLGNVVTYLLFTHLWPISVGKRIDPAIATLLQTLAAMMTAATATTRRALASQAQTALAAIRTDIALAGYEPTSVRPDPAWLARRDQFADDIDALESALLLSADKEPATSQFIARRLHALADRFIVTKAPPSDQGEHQSGGWSALPLFHIVNAGLVRLEQKPGG